LTLKSSIQNEWTLLLRNEKYFRSANLCIGSSDIKSQSQMPI
jgi:hypothetical protein